MIKIKNKDLIITIVSNFTLINEEIANWLIDHKVSLCTSLDGPENVHNTNRFIHAKNGNKIGTHKQVVNWINKINNIYKQKGLKQKVGVIPTISKYSLKYYKEIIDQFIELEVDVLDFRPLTYVENSECEYNIF